MNIYVLVKRTFDTEEKIVVTMVKFMKMVQSSSLIHTMNMQLKKQFKYVTHMVEK